MLVFKRFQIKEPVLISPFLGEFFLKGETVPLPDNVYFIPPGYVQKLFQDCLPRTLERQNFLVDQYRRPCDRHDLLYVNSDPYQGRAWL